MRLLGWNSLVAVVFASSLAACGDNTGGVGDGSSGSETGSGSSTTNGMTSAPTSQSTTNMTMGGTSASTTADPTTTGVDSSGGDTTTTADPTTTGAEDCSTCIDGNCGEELDACLADRDCACWIDCINRGNGGMECFQTCGPPPGELPELGDCVDNECDMECNGGGGSTTNGGMGDYDECQNNGECPMDLECNDFVNYCSIQCMGDANACPVPATGDAEPVCSNFSDNCILPCGNGETCPDGMSCQNVGGPNDLCAF